MILAIERPVVTLIIEIYTYVEYKIDVSQQMMLAYLKHKEKN